MFHTSSDPQLCPAAATEAGSEATAGSVGGTTTGEALKQGGNHQRGTWASTRLQNAAGGRQKGLQGGLGGLWLSTELLRTESR